MRSRRTGKALARQGSRTSLVPDGMTRMWSWQIVVPFSGPWASPLIMKPQEPQMPSRQSCSKVTGSWPFFTNDSLSTSSISRKERSPEMSLTW